MVVINVIETSVPSVHTGGNHPQYLYKEEKHLRLQHLVSACHLCALARIEKGSLQCIEVGRRRIVQTRLLQLNMVLHSVKVCQHPKWLLRWHLACALYLSINMKSQSSSVTVRKHSDDLGSSSILGKILADFQRGTHSFNGTLTPPSVIHPASFARDGLVMLAS